jgi:uncharacterized protein (TIGR02646 family)
MTLIEIDLNLEPLCLKDLRSNSLNTYSDLKDVCKTEVTDVLREGQKNLCAYCQKSILDVITIEHYLSQAEHPNAQLDFSNFLGVCTGKFYIDKMTGKHVEHCDTSRKNISLSIDPRQHGHIKTIYYGDDGKIRSKDANFDSDLNKVC